MKAEVRKRTMKASKHSLIGGRVGCQPEPGSTAKFSLGGYLMTGQVAAPRKGSVYLRPHTRFHVGKDYIRKMR